MKPRVPRKQNNTDKAPALFDRWFLLAVMGIIGIGLLMVASASIVISEKQFGVPFHYLIRQISFLG